MAGGDIRALKATALSGFTPDPAGILPTMRLSPSHAEMSVTMRLLPGHPPLSLRDISPSRGEIDREAGGPIDRKIILSSARQPLLYSVRQPPSDMIISPLEGEMSRRDRGGSLGERFPDERHPGESHLTKIHSTPSPNFPENLR